MDQLQPEHLMPIGLALLAVAILQIAWPHRRTLLFRLQFVGEVIAELARRAVNRYVHFEWRYGQAEEPDTDPNSELNAASDRDNLRATTITTTPTTTIAITQPEHNTLLLESKAQALALLVRAGKVTETEGIKIVYNLKSIGSTNREYVAARAALRQALEQLDQADNPYPELTKDGRPVSMRLRRARRKQPA